MKLIIVPRNSADVKSCLALGLMDFFVDLEFPEHGGQAPDSLGTLYDLREISESITTYLRVDGNGIKNEDYLEDVLVPTVKQVQIRNGKKITFRFYDRKK